MNQLKQTFPRDYNFTYEEYCALTGTEPDKILYIIYFKPYGTFIAIVKETLIKNVHNGDVRCVRGLKIEDPLKIKGVSLNSLLTHKMIKNDINDKTVLFTKEQRVFEIPEKIFEDYGLGLLTFILVVKPRSGRENNYIIEVE